MAAAGPPHSRLLAADRSLDHLSESLGGLRFASSSAPSPAPRPPVSRERMLTRVRDMRHEMDTLFAYFYSGRGYLDRLDGVHERISVNRKAPRGDFDVHIAAYEEESDEDRCYRRRKLHASIRVAFFAKKAEKAPVHFITEESANSGRGGVNALREGDVIPFYMDFGREKRAMDVLERIEDELGAGLSPSMQALLGGRENILVVDKNAGGGEKIKGGDVWLNVEQQKAVDASSARLVQPIFGPPGTGKTTVITALLNAPVCSGDRILAADSRHIVIVCSEKNLAVDAVAEKLLRAGGSEPEHRVWRETIARGVPENIGPNTARFLLDNKVLNAREVLRAEAPFAAAQSVALEKMDALEKVVRSHAPFIASVCSELLVSDLDDIAKEGKQRSKISLSEALRRRIWDVKYLAEAALGCAMRVSKVPGIPAAWRAINIEYQKFRVAERRVIDCSSKAALAKKQAKFRLQREARVVLVTLGSAHGVASCLDVDLSDPLLQLSATVICDEASTVHTPLFISAMYCFESRLTNIVIVGDDRQLDPYWPISDGGKKAGAELVQPVALFKDALGVASGTGNYLREQYRMPLRIMTFVNEFFYPDRPLIFGKGKDNTGTPQPLEWIHVPVSDSGRRGRRNEASRAEANETVDLVKRAREAGESVLVITPYRQQRDQLEKDLGIESGVKRAKRGYTPESSCPPDGGINVSTVDGAQGKEAFLVVISMVKDVPSRFLTMKRLCVMLSRAKGRMVVVGDLDSHLSCDNLPMRKLAQISSVTAAKRVKAV